MIVFDASTLFGAGLKTKSVPELALLMAEATDVFAVSAATDAEMSEVLNRPKFARAIPDERRRAVLEIVRRSALWFE